MSVAALILAAGRGTRFRGGPKLTALLDGRPVVRHVAEAALASGAEPVLAVLGHEGEAVGAALPAEVVRILNPGYAAGLSTSLRAGFAALPSSRRAAIVLLGDMPRVGPELIDALIEAWRRAGEPAAAVPVHRGVRGNPVLLSRALSPALGTLTGDRGAGPLLRGRPDVLEWATDDPAVACDVDTPEALAALAAGTHP